MRISIVAGARPNFIKVAPIIRVIERAKASDRDIDYELVYCGREDDPTLEASLFEDLQIARPNIFLGVDCDNLNELTGLVMSKFEYHLQQHPADAVIVVDDLASTMAVSIVTKKQGILLAHIAAGTRSFDINMPKEINRLVIDGLSDMLFTAGMSNNSIANREGAELSKVYMVGNILIDNLRFNRERIENAVLPDGLKDIVTQPYLVFTLNRKALIADRPNLEMMMRKMAEAASGLPILAPLRGLAAATVRRIIGSGPSPLILTEPLGYLEFSHLTAHAAGIITDSGNVAEEATFNGVPCVTLNSYTEHIETVKIGTNELVGEDPEKLGGAVRKIVSGQWKHAAIPDRWDGRSAERIVQILMEWGTAQRK